MTISKVDTRPLIAANIRRTVRELNRQLSAAYDAELVVAVDVEIIEQGDEEREYVKVRLGAPL